MAMASPQRVALNISTYTRLKKEQSKKARSNFHKQSMKTREENQLLKFQKKLVHIDYMGLMLHEDLRTVALPSPAMK